LGITGAAKQFERRRHPSPIRRCFVLGAGKMSGIEKESLSVDWDLMTLTSFRLEICFVEVNSWPEHLDVSEIKFGDLMSFDRMCTKLLVHGVQPTP
jgi:hypothetical protein